MAIVCLSVCHMSHSKSRTEWRRKLKIGRKPISQVTRDLIHRSVARSKVKVTRPINTVTENLPYPQNWKAY